AGSEAGTVVLVREHTFVNPVSTVVVGEASLSRSLSPRFWVLGRPRHDFYGTPFVRDYLTMLQVGPGWRNLLDANRVNWVLAPCDSSLANALKAVPDWRVIHEDETAVIFERTVPLEFTSTTGWSRPSGLR